METPQDAMVTLTADGIAEEVDPNRHLHGAYSLVMHQPQHFLHHQCSLLAAGFWNYLREDITFSLFEEWPLKMELDEMPLPDQYVSDEVYLNTISVILGRLVNAVFGNTVDSQWLSLCSQVRAWRTTLPSHFDPIFRGSGGHGTLPRICFLSDSHGRIQAVMIC